jgi:hypothetical protein
MRGLLLVVALAACTPSTPPVAASRDAPIEVLDGPVREYEHRVVGDISGQFAVAKQTVRVAEPIMVALEVRSLDGPLVVFAGGDSRNAAYFPMQVGVKVQRMADGAVVCDSVASPAIMNFGGPGGDRTLGEGELMRESFVLNPICPALATPGNYRVSLHRRLMSMRMMTKPPGAKVPTSCHAFPLHEDAELEGLHAECIRMLREAPSVTTNVEIEVLPYQREEVQAAIAGAYARADASDPKDEIAKSRIDAWLCNWVSCACAGLPDARTVALPEERLTKLETGCMGRP